MGNLNKQILRAAVVFLLLGVGIYFSECYMTWAEDNIFTDNVGIGTTNPQAQLEIATPGGSSIEFDTSDPNCVLLKINGEVVVRITP